MPHPNLLLRVLLALLLIAPSTLVRAQGYLWPDAGAPCNGTLQACIDGVIDNAVISINTNAPSIASDPVISRGLVLRGAPGLRPVFPVGIGIDVNLTAAHSVELDGLVLRNGGMVNVVASLGAGAGTAHFTAEHMRFEHIGVPGGGFLVDFVGESELVLRIRDNDYLRTGGAGNFAVVQAHPGHLRGEIAFNRIDIPDGSSSAYGILQAVDGITAWSDVVVAGNRIRGSFSYGAICGLAKTSGPGKLPISQMRFLSNVVIGAVAGSGTGLCLFAGEGYIDAQVINNSFIDLGTALRVEPRPFDPPTTVYPIYGEFANNLFAHNASAVAINPVASALTNRNNLYFANTSNGSGYSAGTGSRYDDPRLFSHSQPYLLATSPAIDVGVAAALPPSTTWPSLDAEGHRRVKRSTVDIGAYEYGDGWFDAVGNGSNNIGNTLLLDHPTSNGAPAARVFATPNFSLGTVTNMRPFGVYWHSDAARWRVFNQDIAAMPTGAGYNLFAPAAPTALTAFPDIGLFLHRLPASGPTNPSDLMNHSSLDNRPDQIAIVTQNWNPQDPPASTGVYNNSIVTLQYYGDNLWRIANVSGFSLPNSAAFNVYAQPPSPSAFHHVAEVGNTVGGTTTLLSHPLLDGKPCARIQVTSVFGDREFDVAYLPAYTRWGIYSVGTMPDGARFNVLFSPRQIEECSGPQMFSDGFE